MKIAVTAQGNDLDAQMDPRFGRCAAFLVVDTETMAFEVIANANVTAGGGAGIQSAQLMAEQDVTAVLTGNCGPNAFRTLEAANITVITGINGVIRDVVTQFKDGELSATKDATVGSHFGMSS